MPPPGMSAYSVPGWNECTASTDTSVLGRLPDADDQVRPSSSERITPAPGPAANRVPTAAEVVATCWMTVGCKSEGTANADQVRPWSTLWNTPPAALSSEPSEGSTANGFG